MSVATTIIEYGCEEEKDSEVEIRAAVIQANVFKIMYCLYNNLLQNVNIT